MSAAGPVAVLLLQMGAPGTIGEITPFLENLFSDRAIIPLRGPAWFGKTLAFSLARLRTRKVVPRYQAIGGGSPLVPITARQAAALERWLAERGIEAVVRPVMRYCPPRAGEVVDELREKGLKRILFLSLYPHYSSATTGSSLAELAGVARSGGLEIAEGILRWGNSGEYVELLADWIKEADRSLEESGLVRRAALFSAHNLPKKLIDSGDPYLKEIKETFRAVSGKLGGLTSRLSFQSSIGPVEWLEPETGTVITELAAVGVDGLILVPVSFVSDHIETLYDMDIIYRKQAKEAGIANYHRLRAFNDHPRFIECLGKMVYRALEEGK